MVPTFCCSSPNSLAYCQAKATALWVDGFIWHGSLGSFVFLCLPAFVSRCLPAWMLGTALWVHGFHLSPFVSLHLCPVVSQPGCLARLSVDGFICLPLSPFICPVVFQPGFLARLSGWHLSSFVSLRCSFVLLCLLLSPSLGGRVHLSPFVLLLGGIHLSSVVSLPGCLARLSGWTDSFVSLRLACGWTNSFVFRCLPVWMSGTALRADSFICLPLSLHLSPVVLQPRCLLSADSFASLCLPFVSCCFLARILLGERLVSQLNNTHVCVAIGHVFVFQVSTCLLSDERT